MEREKGRGFNIGGECYEGEFRDNEINADGVYEWNDDNVYKGD